MSCVLTLALEESAQQIFEAQRRQWFPPERNLIPAHLTIFHAVPETGQTHALLQDVAGTTASFAMEVGSIRSIGKGVAYFIESAQALALGRRLRSAFVEHLNQQDLQPFRPHVVVQNKVEPAVARQTLTLLQAGFSPWHCRAIGLDLWRYLGGPWQHLHRFDFTG